MNGVVNTEIVNVEEIRETLKEVRGLLKDAWEIREKLIEMQRTPVSLKDIAPHDPIKYDLYIRDVFGYAYIDFTLRKHAPSGYYHPIIVGSDKVRTWVQFHVIKDSETGKPSILKIKDLQEARAEGRRVRVKGENIFDLIRKLETLGFELIERVLLLLED